MSSSPTRKTITATPRMRYRQHKASAKARGIDFDMTFEEWWAIWEPYYERRGRTVGAMHMCRKADAGGYTVGNVRIDTMEANHAERVRVYLERQRMEGRLPASERVGGVPDWLYGRAPRERIRLCDDEPDESY